MIDKPAFFKGISDTVAGKFSDPKFTHEVAIPLLDKVFSHNTATTLAGAGLGAGAGLLGTALSDDQKPKRWLRNALLGGVAGAGAGGAASVLAPEMSKAVTDRFVRQPIGKVITNWVDPYNYKEDKLKTILNTPPRELLRSLIKDKPVYLNPGAGSSSESFDQTGYSAREPIYRKGFSLPNRSAAFENLYVDNFDGSIGFNKGHSLGRSILDSIARQGEKEWSAPINSTSIEDNPVMGHYTRKILGNNAFAYNDTWDFDLHSNESLDSKENWARYFLNNISKPISMQGIVTE